MIAETKMQRVMYSMPCVCVRADSGTMTTAAVPEMTPSLAPTTLAMQMQDHRKKTKEINNDTLDSLRLNGDQHEHRNCALIIKRELTKWCCDTHHHR